MILFLKNTYWFFAHKSMLNLIVALKDAKLNNFNVFNKKKSKKSQLV